MTPTKKIAQIKVFLVFLIHFQLTIIIINSLSVTLDTALSKFVFATKFACFNLALKTSAAKVLNSGVVIYLS